MTKKNCRRKYEYRKSFSIYLFKENDKPLSCLTVIKFNVTSGIVHTYSMFIRDKKAAPIGRLDKNKRKNIYGKVPASDNEVLKRLKELIKDNWSIKIRDIKEKTGFSNYKISKMYMKAKREIGSRKKIFESKM